MKHAIFIMAVFTLLCVPLQKTSAGQEPTPIGVKSLVEFKGDYRFFNIKRFSGPDGTTLVTGGFTGELILGTDTLQNEEQHGGFLGLLDSIGQWKWVTRFEGNGYSQVNHALWHNDSWIITGAYTDTISIGDVQLVDEGYGNVFWAKVGPKGEFLIVNSLDLFPVGGRQFLAGGKNGEFFMGTMFSGEFHFGDSIYNSNNHNHILLMRFKENGELDRICQLHSRGVAELIVFEPGINGGLVIGVNYNDTLWHNNRTLTNQGLQDFFIASLNRNFNPQKIMYSQNTGSKSLIGALPHDAGFVFYGEYMGDFSYDGKDFPSGNVNNLFMFKLNWKGEIQWNHHLGGLSRKVFQGLSKGDNLEIYALIHFRGEVNMLMDDYETTDAVYKTFMARFNANGKPQWIKQAKNLGDMIIHMNPISRKGQIEISGNNLSHQLRVFDADFEPNRAGTFLLDLFDCDYGKKVDMPEEIYLCGPGYITGDEGFARYFWNDSWSGQSYFVEHSGLQFLEVKDEYGCLSYDTVFVHVIPDQTLVIDGNDMICPDGGNTMLMVDSQDHIKWNTGAETQVILVDEAGLYNVTVTDQYGCNYTAEIEIGVHESTPPFLDDYYMATVQDTISIYPGEYFNYRWSNGETSPLLIVAGNSMKEGIHLMGLDVQDFNGCFYHHEFTVEVFQLKNNSAGNPTVSQLTEEDLNDLAWLSGIEDLDSDVFPDGACDFRIFPNPGKEVFQIRINVGDGYITESGDEENKQLLMFGTRGELVVKQTIAYEVNHYTLNLQGKVQPGTYYIALLSGYCICSIKKLVVLP